MASNPEARPFDKVQDAAIRALLGLVLALPYRTRVRLMGWTCAHILGPIAGWRKRVRANLALACPDLPDAEVERLARAVPNNVGRTLIEIYSGAEFKDHVLGTPLSGPGLAPFREARAQGRPVVLITGHLGNFDSLRAALTAEGHVIAGLYRRMRNTAFNEHYVAALSAIGEPLFASDRAGVAGFVRHLAKGGIVGILTDVYSSKGADVTFFGQPAPTATSACEWAVKYDALVVPCYGLRKPDGLTFDIRLQEPIPLGDPVAMTQTINDGLEALVRDHMEQWFWIHRRWKPWRKRRGKKARSAA
ncbi:lysophospholipid acyltransferase family protein [Maribius pontilimi]|uniref:Lysophospholipid acyltransferase family protein n=1 Tax=Palleronia pontilimi TaxID=1964209 RepID=A0A934ICF9_9RHOB|nr:lysophospholipid acyltransferase family protein [Palleronia pontilimi]MBJ3763101.1 lysophospholipid acyltransferase family protein [Palleronia pontilimi]